MLHPSEHVHLYPSFARRSSTSEGTASSTVVTARSPDSTNREAIAEKHGKRPSVITTTTAEHEYDAEGVLEHVDEAKHYGHVSGATSSTTLSSAL
jgi:hypothetical protein